MASEKVALVLVRLVGIAISAAPAHVDAVSGSVEGGKEGDCGKRGSKVVGHVLGSDHRLSFFEARSWANVSALHDINTGSYEVVYSTRCGASGWTHRIEPYSYNRNPHAIGAVDEAGIPAFLIATGAPDGVLLGMP